MSHSGPLSVFLEMQIPRKSKEMQSALNVTTPLGTKQDFMPSVSRGREGLSFQGPARVFATGTLYRTAFLSSITLRGLCSRSCNESRSRWRYRCRDRSPVLWLATEPQLSDLIPGNKQTFMFCLLDCRFSPTMRSCCTLRTMSRSGSRSRFDSHQYPEKPIGAWPLCHCLKSSLLQLLGELLLDRHNFVVMTRYISKPENLKLMMNLLRDKSPNIQFEAFHVFKVRKERRI